MTPEYEHVFGNLRQAMRFFGEATGAGDVRRVGQGLAIYSGIEYGVFNICMLDPGCQDAERALLAFSKYFRPRAHRWSTWVCPEALAPDVYAGLLAALSRMGLHEIAEAPGMIAETLAPPKRELPAIECVPVDSQSLRDTFGCMASVCFEVPIGVARQIYYPERAWKGAYRGYVGRVAGRPVGIVALVATGTTLGVYSLAIQPESRRLGYGEALLRAAIDQARAQAKYDRIVLQSSESGESLYRRMGFREVTQFSVYLTK